MGTIGRAKSEEQLDDDEYSVFIDDDYSDSNEQVDCDDLEEKCLSNVCRDEYKEDETRRVIGDASDQVFDDDERNEEHKQEHDTDRPSNTVVDKCII